MSKLCWLAKNSVLGPTPSYPNILGQYWGTFYLNKCAKTKKNPIVKERKNHKKKMGSQVCFFYNKAFGPYKKPTSRENTTLLILTFRASLANVRKNKI